MTTAKRNAMEITNVPFKIKATFILKLEIQKIIPAENFMKGCTVLGINHKSIKMKYLIY